MSELSVDHGDQRVALLGLYDTALPEVYGYLASRCGSASVAEDLTSETFLAAVDAVKRRKSPELTVGLADRRRPQQAGRPLASARARAAGRCRPWATTRSPPSRPSDWDVQLDAAIAHETLAALGAHHRSALTLRYLDGLPVARGRRRARPHRRRHRGAARAGPGRVPRQLRARSTLEGRLTMTDPFDALRQPLEPQRPARRFAARAARPPGPSSPSAPTIPIVNLPERKAMPTVRHRPRRPRRTVEPATGRLTPYLAVSDGAAALAWYAEAFGAVEQLPRRRRRRPGRPRRAAHRRRPASCSPTSTPRSACSRRPRSAAQPLRCTSPCTTSTRCSNGRSTPAPTHSQPPADQPHGARHGTLLDPFGHRWMLSQQLEDIRPRHLPRSGPPAPASRSSAPAPDERVAAADRPGTGGGIWAGVFYDDALAGHPLHRRRVRIRGAARGHRRRRPHRGAQPAALARGRHRAGRHRTTPPTSSPTHPGDQALYVVTADPHAVWERCRAAGLDVIRPPESPDYDPGGMGFSVRDREGNIWSLRLLRPRCRRAHSVTSSSRQTTTTSVVGRCAARSDGFAPAGCRALRPRDRGKGRVASVNLAPG